MTVAFWRLGSAAPSYSYDAYVPDNANLLVSDFHTINERSSVRLRFQRPINNGNAYQHCAPGSRVSFTTNATYFRLRGYWNALVTRLDTFNSVGSVLKDGTEIGTFSSPYAANATGTINPVFSLGAGSKTVTIVWPYAAGFDLNGIDIEAGSTISLPTRPSARLFTLGDSISHGMTVSKTTASWAYKLAALKTMQLINLANGSEGADASTANTLTAKSPTASDRILYFIGFNNFYPQQSIASFQPIIQSWLTNARTAAPSTPIYVGMHRTLKVAADYGGTIEPISYQNAISAAELAAGDANTFYIDGNSLISNSAANYADSGIHFNDTGAGLVATALNGII